MSCGHTWSEAQEAILIKVYALSGVKIDSYVGCTQCGLDKLRVKCPDRVAAAEADAERKSV